MARKRGLSLTNILAIIRITDVLCGFEEGVKRVADHLTSMCVLLGTADRDKRYEWVLTSDEKDQLFLMIFDRNPDSETHSTDEAEEINPAVQKTGKPKRSIRPRPVLDDDDLNV